MIAIVTDSSAYLYRAEAERLGVTVVPMSYSLPGQPPFNESYMDASGDYERVVVQNIDKLRTSQATFSAFMSVFNDLVDAGAQVLCLTMSSRLSGTYGNARMSAKETDPENIAVVDSRTTSGGLYLMILEARRMINAGMGLHEVARALRELRDSIRTTFTVDDITPLRRSGRLGSVRMSISTILNIRPVLKCVDGCIVSTGMVRGRHEQYKTLIKSLPDTPCRCVVEGFMADSQMADLKLRVEAAGHEVIQRKLGPVLGIHLGMGSLGVSWIDAPKAGDGAQPAATV